MSMRQIRRWATLATVSMPLAMATIAPAQVPAPDDDPFYAVGAGVSSLANGAIIRSRSIDPTALSVPLPAKRPVVPNAPVYDYHAVLDELAPIGPDRALVARFCRAGVTVQHVEDPINEHISYVGAGAPVALDYLGARFAGEPAPNNCTVGPAAAAAKPARASLTIR